MFVYVSQTFHRSVKHFWIIMHMREMQYPCMFHNSWNPVFMHVSRDFAWGACDRKAYRSAPKLRKCSNYAGFQAQYLCGFQEVDILKCSIHAGSRLPSSAKPVFMRPEPQTRTSTGFQKPVFMRLSAQTRMVEPFLASSVSMRVSGPKNFLKK